MAYRMDSVSFRSPSFVAYIPSGIEGNRVPVDMACFHMVAGWHKEARMLELFQLRTVGSKMEWRRHLESSSRKDKARWAVQRVEPERRSRG